MGDEEYPYFAPNTIRVSAPGGKGPYAVQCPLCKAFPTFPCSTGTPHEVRVKAAEKTD